MRYIDRDLELAEAALLRLTGGDAVSDLIMLEMPNGNIEPYRFHVHVRTANPYLMTCQAPVEDGIHVLAIVSDPDANEAELVGWDWAQKVRAQPITGCGFAEDFGHNLPRRYLRKMSDIRSRILGPSLDQEHSAVA